MEIDNEIIPSPPSVVQRETTIVLVDPIDLVAPVDLVSPVDVPKDIAVGHKNPTWAQKNL
jgi:hypothetical protein